MLNDLKLTNFRKHRRTSLTFQPGLSVVRGANEAGKSTLIEAVCYCIFGVKVLRTSLDDTVTYTEEDGVIIHREPVNTLKVELTITLDGVQYHVKRGKSGAEVNYDGGRVTGQTEVTNFLCSKMGVDPSSAAKLMLANQNEIRGALEAGAKATTELIERLSEFDQIDKVIDLIQENLALGSTAAAESSLAQAEQRLAALGVAGEPDYAALETAIEAAKAEQATAQSAFEAIDEAVAQAQAKLDSERSKASAEERANQALVAARQRFSKVGVDLEAAHRELNRIVAVRTAAQVQQDIDAVGDAARHLQVWARLSKFVGEPSHQDSYSGSFIDLKAAAQSSSTRVSEARDTVAKLKRDEAVAKAGLTNGSCSFCGQDFSDVPAVAQKNAEQRAVIKKLADQIEATEEVQASAQRAYEAHTAIINASAPVLQAVESSPDYLKVVGTSLPPTVVWIGPDIDKLQGADHRLAQLQGELKEVNAEAQRQAAAQARYSTLVEQRDAAEKDVSAAEVALSTCLAHDVPAAEAERQAVQAKRRELQAALSDAESDVRDAEYALRDAKRDHERAAEQRDSLKAEIERRQAEIADVEFNNALLKRVRQCRPAIADKLWTIVLTTVSSYLTEMRGVKSTVTKDAEGFKVNGAVTTGLSGSALDLLGLSIRVALVRTFLPSIPFLVLDEPCAAMEDSRTHATLGFVGGCNFRQVILVTHEDISETVADQLIHI